MSGTTQRRDTARAIGWTPTDWINEVGSAITVSCIYWFESRLAARNGKRWVARRRLDQFERELFMGFTHVAVHPVRREFDRRAAWRVAVVESRRSLRRMLEQIERQWAIATRSYKRLQPRDLNAMWMRVRRQATIMAIRKPPRASAATVRTVKMNG